MKDFKEMSWIELRSMIELWANANPMTSVILGMAHSSPVRGDGATPFHSDLFVGVRMNTHAGALITGLTQAVQTVAEKNGDKQMLEDTTDLIELMIQMFHLGEIRLTDQSDDSPRKGRDN